MDDTQIEDGDREYRNSPRVNFKESPQTHAGWLGMDLSQVRADLKDVPTDEQQNSSPRRLAEALIRDSESMLEGIEHGVIKGNSRIASNLIRAVDLLEQAGKIYDTPIDGLLHVVVRLSQHGLAIDGQSMTENRHTDRLKS